MCDSVPTTMESPPTVDSTPIADSAITVEGPSSFKDMYIVVSCTGYGGGPNKMKVFTSLQPATEYAITQYRDSGLRDHFGVLRILQDGCTEWVDFDLTVAS